MKKFSALLIALMVFMMGFTSVMAVDNTDGAVITTTSYNGNDNDNGVREAAQIIQKTQARVQELQEAKLMVQQTYSEVKQEANEIKVEMLRKRAQLANCSVSDDGEECVALRQEARVATGDYLENLADMLIKHLEVVQIKVKLSEQITDDEEVKIIELIDERKDRLESVKDEIEALKTSDEDSSAERAEIIKKLKEEVVDAKAFLAKISVHVEARQIKELIAQQEQAGDKIEKTLAEMDDGDDAYDDVSELLVEFRGNVDEARKYIELAMDDTDEDITNDVKDETSDYLQKARNEIKESYLALNKMVKRLRQGQVEISDDADTEDGSDDSEISDDSSELNDDSEISDESEDNA